MASNYNTGMAVNASQLRSYGTFGIIGEVFKKENPVAEGSIVVADGTGGVKWMSPTDWFNTYIKSIKDAS